MSVPGEIRPGTGLEGVLRQLAQQGPDAFADLHVTSHQARVLITHIEWLEAQLRTRQEDKRGEWVSHEDFLEETERLRKIIRACVDGDPLAIAQLLPDEATHAETVNG